MTPREYDVAVVGGGHNGLVAAGLLAREGLSAVVLEARDVVGGAAVSEHPFGPDYTITSLSYVVSLLPPALVRALDLERHGYHVYPQGPYFAPRLDGRYLRLPDDAAERHAEIAKFSRRDADAYPAWDADLARLGALLGPLLEDIPPRLGSRRPADLARQALLLRRLRGFDERTAVDAVRVLSDSTRTTSTAARSSIPRSRRSSSACRARSPGLREPTLGGMSSSSGPSSAPRRPRSRSQAG